MKLRSPASLLLAPILVAWATTGCVATVRGTAGAGVAADGAQPLAGAELGFGFGGRVHQGLLVVAGQAGLHGASYIGGGEYNVNLRTPEKPLGLRVRLDAGAELFYATKSSPTDSAFLLAVVPGVWWMPLQTRRSAHPFVLALEPRIGGRTPVRSETGLSPYGDLNLVFEYDWVPCVLGIGASCPDEPRP